MLPTKLQQSYYDPYYQVQSRTYIYYSRYAAIKPTQSRYTWHHVLRSVGNYARLVFIGALALIVGGIFPLLLSYELLFKSLVANNCSSCVVIGARPYFEFDYVIATMLAVLGFIMPILVLYVFIQIIRNRVLRHDLFH